MPRPMRWPGGVKPRPGTTTRSMYSVGMGLPEMGSLMPGPVVVMPVWSVVISAGSLRRWSQLTVGALTDPLFQPVIRRPIVHLIHPKVFLLYKTARIIVGVFIVSAMAESRGAGIVGISKMFRLRDGPTFTNILRCFPDCHGRCV